MGDKESRKTRARNFKMFREKLATHGKAVRKDLLEVRQELNLPELDGFQYTIECTAVGTWKEKGAVMLKWTEQAAAATETNPKWKARFESLNTGIKNTMANLEQNDN
jgi:hypothetical protein